MKKLKLCVPTELQHWTLFITKYIFKMKSLRINQNHSFYKGQKGQKIQMVDTIALRHQLFYFIGTFSPEFFRSNRKYCNCSLLAKQLKTTARLPTKFCSDLARFFRENTRSKSTKSMKNFPLNKFTLFEECFHIKSLTRKI